jgi:hypothetical protein
MHAGGVIRLAVADVHIKINAPLAMRNFHPSRMSEKALGRAGISENPTLPKLPGQPSWPAGRPARNLHY